MHKEIRYKLLIGIICHLLLVSTLSAQKTNPNGYNKFYFDNGQLSSEGYLKNGLPEGYWKNYFESGILKSEGNRDGHQLDSIWKFYNAEGILTEEISYEAGKRNGVTKKYSKEGFLLSSTPYKNDRKQGVAFTYYSDGNIHTGTPFVNGVENGKEYEFNPKDDIITITEYQNGIFVKQEKINRKDKSGDKQGLWKEFYEDRTVKTEGRYQDNLKHGYWKEYSTKGMLVATYKFDKGQLVTDAEELADLDVEEKFYPDSDGQIRFRGTYRKGKPHGTHIWFAEDGTIDSAKIFKNSFLVASGKLNTKGLRIGTWREYYYPGGELKGIGSYEEGYRSGEWIYYFQDGAIEQKGKYSSKGKPNEKWKWFYPSGQIMREETFKNGKEDGWLIEYSDTGKVITKGEYVDGLEDGEWFYEMGDHYQSGRYEYGLKQGVWKHIYLTTDKTRFEGEFFDDLAQGKHTWYYDTGVKQLEGKFISDVKEGEWKRYNPDGTVFVTIEYSSGKEIKVDGMKLKVDQKEEN